MEGQAEASGARVLVVDDDLRVGAALEKGLRVLGYEVMRAADGEAGLAMAYSRRPEVILLDLRMPGIDGHTFLRRLNAQGGGAAVVVMSGQGDMDDVIDVMREGAVDFLRKPWGAGELATSVARAVAARAARLQDAPPDEAAEPSRPAMATQSVRIGEAEHPLPPGRPVPAVPPVLATLRAIVHRPEITAAEVVAVIEQDPALAAEVARVASAAPESGGTRPISLQAVVTRLGARQVHNIVETICLRRQFTSRDPATGRVLQEIWRHAVGQATAMRAIAAAMKPDRGLPPVDPETAYLIGLLADVGAATLLTADDARGELDARMAEVRARHAEVGAGLIARWIDDPAAPAAVAEHHPDDNGPASTYGRMLVLAADLVGPDPTAPTAHSQPMVDLCLAELDLDLARLTALVAGVDDGCRELIEACG